MPSGGKRKGAGRPKGEEKTRMSVFNSRFKFLRMLAAAPTDIYNKIKKMVLESLE